MDDGFVEVPYVTVHLTSGVMSQKIIPVLAHEIPIFMVTHGEDNVQVIGATGDTKWLHPDEEYSRLGKRFGGNKDGSLVESAFGRRMEGRLAGLMGRSIGMFPLPDEAQVKSEDDDAADKKVTKKKGRTRLKSKPTD